MSLLLLLGGGGGVNYTLTCSAGAYTLAGQDATLTYVAGAVDAKVTWLQLDTDASATVNYTLTCAAGSYTLTGQDATFRRGYSLACDSGAYVLAGNPATLTYVPGVGAVNYTLTCDAGAYVVTGQAAVFNYSRGLACDVGSYSLVGQAATFQRGYSLACDSGSYTITGQAATLTRGYSLVCDAGAYALSGNPATLDYISGIAPVTYTLLCDSGAYAITGQDAVLTYSGQSTGNGFGFEAGIREVNRKPLLQRLREAKQEAKEKEEVRHLSKNVRQRIKAIEIEAVKVALSDDDERFNQLLDRWKRYAPSQPSQETTDFSYDPYYQDFLTQVLLRLDHMDNDDEEAMLVLLLA
jgi:hypothetical protein